MRGLGPPARCCRPGEGDQAPSSPLSGACPYTALSDRRGSSLWGSGAPSLRYWGVSGTREMRAPQP